MRKARRLTRYVFMKRSTKGAELMAAHIRQLAGEAGVPIMRDVPLARALYDLELGQKFPKNYTKRSPWCCVGSIN